MSATPAAAFDPIRFCVFTTVALLAWVCGPPVAVTLMSGLGLWAYATAWRQGLRESRCFLRDARLVMAYLGAAFLVGLAFTVRGALALLG
jgi:hypothetical protein